MKGVDLCDQMTGYHLINHRSKKWWRRLYFYLQMVAVHNAYIVAKESNPVEAAAQWPLFQDIVEDLSLELIGDVRSARAAPLVHAPQRATALHEVVPMYERYKTCRKQQFQSILLAHFSHIVIYSKNKITTKLPISVLSLFYLLYNIASHLKIG